MQQKNKGANGKKVRRKKNGDKNEDNGGMKQSGQMNRTKKIIHLNKMKKDYEIEKMQKGKYEGEEKKQVESMIEVVDDQIEDLMEEEKGDNKTGKTMIDQNLLNEASETALNRGKEWDDLSYVNNMMISVKLEKLKTNDEGKKRAIHKISEMYRIRKNMLITQIVTYQKRLEEEGRIAFEEGTGEIIVIDKTLIEDENSDNQEDEIMEEMEEDARDTAMQEGYETKRKEVVDLTGSEREVKEGNDQEKNTIEITQESNESRQYMEPSEKKKTKIAHDNTSGEPRIAKSYKETVIEDNKDEEREDGERKEVRVHLQFKAEKVQGMNIGQQIRPTLHDVMECTKRVDMKAQLMGWKEDDELKPLAGREIKLIGETAIIDYINIPKRTKSLMNQKMYYQFGLRIKTEIQVDEFIDKWNKARYNMKDEIQSLQYMNIRRSEMQTSSSPFPIGYFLGSVERGEYTTVRKDIRNITGTNAEMSFQIVHQKDITNTIWEEARNIATKEYQNPNSRGNKRIKYANSPQAMVVYVDRHQKMENARVELYNRYGKSENGKWRILEDGSRMKFVPMFRNEIQSEKVFQRMKEELKRQATTKAGDTTMLLPLKDIFEEKEYLDGRSMEDIIHNAMSDDDSESNIPLFKHIVRRWMPNDNEAKYEVAVQGNMVEKASKFLRRIKHELINTFGSEVEHHFLGAEDYRKNTNTGRGAEDEDTTIGEIKSINIDKEMENMIIQDDQPDVFGRIYLEGIEKLNEKQQEEEPRAMLINEPENEMSQCGMSGISKSSGISNVTKLTQNNQRVTWSKDLPGKDGKDEATIQKENEEKIKITIREYQINEKEINEWIRENYKSTGNNRVTTEQAIREIPYDKWKLLIRDTKKKRKNHTETEKNNDHNEGKKTNEYDAPELDEAIGRISSEDLMGYKDNNNNKNKRASHPTNGELSRTAKTSKSQQSGESGGQ